jgi:hypothetical protein
VESMKPENYDHDPEVARLMGGPRRFIHRKNWRRRPDLNRRWRFCRPLPYHLATAPFREVSHG